MNLLKNVNGIWLPQFDRDFTPQVENRRDGYQLSKYDAAKRYVQNFRHAVDVGAHVGLWTRHMLKHFQRVTAFEPLAVNAQCHRLNVKDRVALHECALGNVEKLVSLYVPPGQTGGVHVVEGDDVQMKTLDSFALEDVDFLKMDCEGYELFVCQGAEQTILKCKPVVVVEQKPNRDGRFGLHQTEAVEFLTSLGMRERDCISGDYILSW